jgi:UDP-N-acetylglucosamine 1-carboxyvinyltransferase
LKLGVGLGCAKTRSEITIKDVSWDNLGVIPSTFRKIGITLERGGVMIFIPAHEDGYEIKQILTVQFYIADAPWPGFHAWIY